MPLLDVSDVLIDPDFADTLTVTRVGVVVGDNGRGVPAMQSTLFVGVVTQADGETFERYPDAARVAGSITITTPFALRVAGANYDADIVTDATGRQFTVVAVADYSRYGAGFVSALCQPRAVS
jgi:hypothetical protein